LCGPLRGGGGGSTDCSIDRRRAIELILSRPEGFGNGPRIGHGFSFPGSAWERAGARLCLTSSRPPGGPTRAAAARLRLASPRSLAEPGNEEMNRVRGMGRGSPAGNETGRPAPSWAGRPKPRGVHAWGPHETGLCVEGTRVEAEEAHSASGAFRDTPGSVPAPVAGQALSPSRGSWRHHPPARRGGTGASVLVRLRLPPGVAGQGYTGAGGRESRCGSAVGSRRAASGCGAAEAGWVMFGGSPVGRVPRVHPGSSTPWVGPTRRGQVTVSDAEVKRYRMTPGCHCEIRSRPRSATASGRSGVALVGCQEASGRRAAGADSPARATATAYLRAA
jgi:hypothetical protein